MLKIGILSDTHLKKITDRLEEIYQKYLFNMDIIIHAGDYISIEVVEFLNRDNFHGVRGNMDSHEVKQILPDKKVIEAGSHRIIGYSLSGPHTIGIMEIDDVVKGKIVNI